MAALPIAVEPAAAVLRTLANPARLRIVLAGGLLGMALAVRLATRKAVLNRIFAAIVFVVAAYMLYRNAAAAGPG